MAEQEKFRIVITDENSFHFFSVLRSSGENTKIISFNLKSGKTDQMDRVLGLAKKLTNDHYPELDADEVFENSQQFEPSSLFGPLISSINSDQAVQTFLISFVQNIAMTEQKKFRIVIIDENSFHFFSVRSSGENNGRDFSTKIISFNLKSGKTDPMDSVLTLVKRLINDHYPELDADGVLENSQGFEPSSLVGQLISS